MTNPTISLATFLALSAGISSLVPNKVISAVYLPKAGSTFRTEPNGEIMTVYPGMIETPPLERQNEWCFFKLYDGRGNAINPPAGWTECHNLDVNGFVGM